MTVLLNDLGDGFITFPEFQRQLRDYERALLAAPVSHVAALASTAAARGMTWSGVSVRVITPVVLTQAAAEAKWGQAPPGYRRIGPYSNEKVRVK